MLKLAHLSRGKLIALTLGILGVMLAAGNGTGRTERAVPVLRGRAAAARGRPVDRISKGDGLEGNRGIRGVGPVADPVPGHRSGRRLFARFAFLHRQAGAGRPGDLSRARGAPHPRGGGQQETERSDQGFSATWPRPESGSGWATPRPWPWGGPRNRFWIIPG